MPDQKSPGRLLYLDNIKWFVIILVVVMHLKVTYGDMGIWYYNESQAPDLFSLIVFGACGSFLQAFIMGLLFFISGYFTPRSLDRKGLFRFISDRFVRLGLPTLIYMLILNPLTLLIMALFKGTRSGFLPGYLHYVTSLRFLTQSGPLWFCVALLVFSIVYAFLHLATGKRAGAKIGAPLLLSHGLVAGIGVLLALATFLFRIIWPSGSLTHTFYNMQLGNFAQYILMFALGIVAYRRDLLDRIDYRFGAAWLKLAIFCGIPFWAGILVVNNGMSHIDLYLAGVHWQSLAYATWESLFCLGMSLGLIVVFRRYWNAQGRVTQLLSHNAFAVYVFHALIVVLITMLFRNLVLYPLLKMVLMAIIIIPICFISCACLRKIPVMRFLFS